MFSRKPIVFGFIFLCILTGGSFLWYQQSRQETRVTDDNGTEKVLPLAETPEAEDTKEVRVSVLGLGPYPEVPDAFLASVGRETADDLWNWIERQVEEDGPDWAIPIELMTRVCIKLGKQGISANDGTFIGEIFYPAIKNVAYVEWAWKDGPDRKPQRYATRIEGKRQDIEKVRHYFNRGEVPPGWTVKSFEEGGIDPYKFLNLKRR